MEAKYQKKSELYDELKEQLARSTAITTRLKPISEYEEECGAEKKRRTRFLI
ncbi:conserved protein of unknown function [Paenibacillus alvei]|uniref:Uncharacterized protein n=1 Tax=Paenibacillus alvei TaxID=44250 RepID=A0A383RLV7_PAEAL|nr:conserved protein of unknown function [Paenibacillus alvei]